MLSQSCLVSAGCDIICESGCVHSGHYLQWANVLSSRPDCCSWLPQTMDKIDITGAIKTCKSYLAVSLSFCSLLCLYYCLSGPTLQFCLSPYSFPCSVAWIIISLCFSGFVISFGTLCKTVSLSISICLWSIYILSVSLSIYLPFCLLLLLYICRLYLICNLEDAARRFNDTHAEKWFHFPISPSACIKLWAEKYPNFESKYSTLSDHCWRLWLYCSFKMKLES